MAKDIFACDSHFKPKNLELYSHDKNSHGEIQANNLYNYEESVKTDA